MFLLQVVFVFCGLISASGSVKISENDGSGMQQSPATDHTQMDKLEKSEQMSKLVSKVRHFENIQNDTLILAGKLKGENESKTILQNEEDWQPMNVKIKNENNISMTKTVSKPSSLLFQKMFSKDGSKDLKESNKITLSFDKRPSFHVIDVGEFSDDFVPMSKEARSIDNKENVNLPDHLLEKSARFNINEELSFPSFETQFFGSFGELSSHKPELHLPPAPENYHNYESGNYHEPVYEHQDDYHSHHPKPAPKPHPPKREVLSSHAHHQQVPHLSSPVKPGQDVSALYVDDPWKHIDKV